MNADRKKVEAKIPEAQLPQAPAVTVVDAEEVTTMHKALHRALDQLLADE